MFIDEVHTELGKKLGKDGGFTDYGRDDANFDEAELQAISDAVSRYFNQRVAQEWAQTGQELQEHVLADNDIANDAAVLKMVPRRRPRRMRGQR